jgi:hypothetical protein
MGNSNGVTVLFAKDDVIVIMENNNGVMVLFARMM